MYTSLKLATQKVLILVYNLAFSSGFVGTRLGRFLYKHSYFFYKRHLEAGSVKQLRKLVEPGSWVVDVGANIGFFSVLFCQWISDGGQLIALEPEPRNYAMLLNNVKKWQQQGKIETLALAADSFDGVGKLVLNPAHPGDHRLGDYGLDVSTVTLDTVLAQRNWPSVALIKVDVQGAEMRVLSGAVKTLERLSPAFFVEMDECALAQFASSSRSIFSFFAAADYTAHALEKQRISAPLDLAAIAQLANSHSYTDILFLPPRLRQNLLGPG